MSWDDGSWQLFDTSGRRKYLNAAELSRFLAAADANRVRRRALCYVIAHTGCRLSEALALTRHQLDVEGQTLTFSTLKRRRASYRSLPVPSVVVDLLCQLILSDDGRFWPISRCTAWRWVKSAMYRADIADTIAFPKSLRHAFGIRAVTRDIPLPLIQRWMGHSRLSTTSIYLQAVGEEERRLAARMW